MKMNEAVKSTFQSEMDSEFNTSTKMYNRIWDNINNSLPKEGRFNKFIFLRRPKIVFSICVSIIVIISLTYLFLGHSSRIYKKYDKSFISIENKSVANKPGALRSGRAVPFYVRFDDIYYSATGTYIQDEKIRKIGENELEYMGEIFEIQDIPISQKVSLHIGENIYKIYERKKTFDEFEAMSCLLKLISDENIKKLDFPAKSGCKEAVVKIYDIYSNIKQIQIKLENKIEKTDKYRFHIILSVSWSSKDYNINSEHDENLEHFWEFEVTPDKIVPIKQGGSQIFNLVM